ncbi:hypothetical protein AM1_H0010 (plasmid) [Acaryochloris marina MBIC11017]|uniref:Uncharacterized protein n=1 Tax=Acaryochloris marina (strain MBIC 11017) TaxID=329726 RepID=A8ZQS7_ACAM1|nr:hypothetical protein AM1_H0010 [Acaryochloris marina MBIC11017]
MISGVVLGFAIANPDTNTPKSHLLNTLSFSLFQFLERFYIA